MNSVDGLGFDQGFDQQICDEFLVFMRFNAPEARSWCIRTMCGILEDQPESQSRRKVESVQEEIWRQEVLSKGCDKSFNWLSQAPNH